MTTLFAMSLGPGTQRGTSKRSDGSSRLQRLESQRSERWRGDHFSRGSADLELDSESAMVLNVAFQSAPKRTRAVSKKECADHGVNWSTCAR